MSLASAAIDPLRFRQALGQFASGVTVITAQINDSPIGFTCGSFYSVSINPALVSFCVKKESAAYPAIQQVGRFAVNILNAEQSALSNQFAQRGGDKWRAVDWSLSERGNPLIAGAIQWIECEIYAEHEAGDHLIVVGEVKALSQAQAREPLVHFTGQYRQLAEAAASCASAKA